MADKVVPSLLLSIVSGRVKYTVSPLTVALTAISSLTPVPTVESPSQRTEETRKLERLLLDPEFTRVVFGKTSGPLGFLFTCVLYSSISDGIANRSIDDALFLNPRMTDAASPKVVPLVICVERSPSLMTGSKTSAWVTIRKGSLKVPAP